MESLTEEGYRPLRLKISDDNGGATGHIDNGEGIGRGSDVYCRYYKPMVETKGKVNETNKVEWMGKGVEKNIEGKKENGIKSGVVLVGGVGGGWDSPARGLYHSLSIRLSRELGICSLRIRFRHSTD